MNLYDILNDFRAAVVIGGHGVLLLGGLLYYNTGANYNQKKISFFWNNECLILLYKMDHPEYIVLVYRHFGQYIMTENCI